MTQQDAVAQWVRSAFDDLDTAVGLFDLGKYVHCLFFCHLATEKMIKAVYTKQHNDAPPILHHLAKLWKTITVPIGGPATEEVLNEMTTFNVEARYDIFKQKLYKKATKEYTERFLALTKEILAWLKTYL
ncbi:HEPN domain-containing protein [Patescibacteria group bacterium]|nr:HEPN domain-containing protein [Patescibacteria group bacterium]